MHPETFVAIADAALDHPWLEYQGRSVLLALARYANATTLQTEVSSERICLDLAMGRTTFYKGRTQLLEAGVIVKVGKSKRWNTTIYEISLSALRSPPNRPQRGQEISKVLDKDLQERRTEISRPHRGRSPSGWSDPFAGTPLAGLVEEVSEALMESLIDHGLRREAYRRDALQPGWLNRIGTTVVLLLPETPPVGDLGIREQFIRAAGIAPTVLDFSGTNRNDNPAYRFCRGLSRCLAVATEEERSKIEAEEEAVRREERLRHEASPERQAQIAQNLRRKQELRDAHGASKSTRSTRRS